LVNAEDIGVAKDHQQMVRFASENDDDFQDVCGRLQIMVNEALETVSKSWNSWEQINSG
jgi:hypothetical protein